MADRRMVSRAIATSETQASLSEFSQLTWLNLIPHLDDFGRQSASPAKLKATIMPLSPRPVADVVVAIADCIRVGHIIVYRASDGRLYLHAVNFDRWQTGLNKRTRTRFPENGDVLTAEDYLATTSANFLELPAIDAEVPGDGLEVPLERNGSERTEVKGKGKGKVSRAPYGDDSVQIRLASLFLELLRKRDPKAKANLQAWARDIELTLKDGRTAEEIEATMRYAQGDDRECRYTTTPARLRKNFTGITLAMQTAHTSSSVIPHPSASNTRKDGRHDAIASHFRD